jgi:hypothetical protein
MSKLTTVISYGVSLAGLGITISALIPAMSGYMNYREARAMILNLLRTQPMRAEPIARNSPGTFYEPIAAAIKAGAQIGGKDPALISTATLPTYDAICGMVKQKCNKLLGRGKLGVMAGAGGAIIAISKGNTSVILIIIGVLCAIGFATLFWHKNDVERTLILARHEVLPEVDQTIAAGRIWAPQ